MKNDVSCLWTHTSTLGDIKQKVLIITLCWIMLSDSIWPSVCLYRSRERYEQHCVSAVDTGDREAGGPNWKSLRETGEVQRRRETLPQDATVSLFKISTFSSPHLFNVLLHCQFSISRFQMNRNYILFPTLNILFLHVLGWVICSMVWMRTLQLGTMFTVASSRWQRLVMLSPSFPLNWIRYIIKWL